jgi:peptidylprolyl isomerase
MSLVTVNYIGWKTDGTMFDTSFNQPGPAKFQLNQVIKGWTEGVQQMVEGERRRFWIPESMAYEGKQEPRGMLVFDVELLAIE